MLVLNNKKIEKFVKEQRERGSNVRWDGWTVVFFRPDARAMYDPKAGVWNRQENSYGYETRVSPDEKGLWRINFKNVRRPNKHPRS